MRGKYEKGGPSAEDKALDLFASMMIEKIESLTGKDGWKKPWFTDGALSWPKNLSGREYNGMNAMFLMMAAEKNGYKLPVWGTFNRFVSMNEQKDKQGNPLPHVGVNKGEKSMPVFLTTFTVVDKDTKEKIPYDDYKRLSDEDKQRYNVYPKMNVYNVFSVEQTNLRDARPELWAKLEAENTMGEKHEQGEQFAFEPVDTMIRDNLWICPIKPTHQDNAYYSLSKDEIVVPEKEQFKDGESFYGTLFHEMTHSTGKEGVLDRIKPSAFGSEEYGREELVAELGSALVAQRYGMAKHLKEDSASYLKSWLDSLKESPQFIKTTLVDVKKATSLITQRIDKVALELKEGKHLSKSVEGRNEERNIAAGQSLSEGQKEGKGKVTQSQSERNEGKKAVFYSSVAYLQMSDDTQLFDRLQENGDYKRILQEAAEYDSGDAIDMEHTRAKATQYAGDDLLTEEEHYAVVYNGRVGGTYEILRKVTEQDVREAINRYGLPHDASADVREVAKGMVAEEFDKMTERHIPAFEMDSGDVLYLAYNRETDCIDVGTTTNAGLAVKHSFAYDHDFNLDMNLQGVHERLGEMVEYQGKEEEEVVAARSGFHR